MFKIRELLEASAGRITSGNKEGVVLGISIDSRSISPGQAFLAIKGNNFDGHDFIAEAIKKGASCIISARRNTHGAIRNTVFIEVKDTIKALGDIARFQRRKFNIPLIAVTGSNGKTTTKEMIAAILSQKFKVLKNPGTKNNHIGLPLALLGLDDAYGVAVLEVGTSRFGEVGYLSDIACPNIGVITNIGPAHLEYFGNLTGVFQEKYTLIRQLKSPAAAILNADDNLLQKEIPQNNKKPFILGFGIKAQADFSASGIRRLRQRINFTVNRKYKFTLKTLGYYNIYNALAAIAVARLLGMAYKEIFMGLDNFNFPRSRLNFIELGKVKFIDDTYNANPLSLRHALEALGSFRAKGRKIFVMGDMLELGSASAAFHRQAGIHVARVCDSFISVGKFSNLTAEAAKKAGFPRRHIFNCQNAAEARNILFKKISPGSDDIVLVKGSRAMKMEEVFKI